MIIKKCDVCKNEVDTLYDKDIVTRIDTINNVQYYKPEKLHICRTCMGSINDALDKCSLDWYEENVKEVDNETNEEEEQNGEDTGGTTVGE